MSEQFVGCTVSVKCIEEVGTYQGQILDLNKDCIILSKAFCNGVPHSSPIVVLWYFNNDNLILIIPYFYW